MSTRQTFPAPLVPDRSPPQETPLSPEWIHAITTLMGHSLQSEIGQKLQKWVLYHTIHDHTDFWASWDPTGSDGIRLFQKYPGKDGSVANLHHSTVRNLITLWKYMNLLIKQDRPADQK